MHPLCLKFNSIPTRYTPPIIPRKSKKPPYGRIIPSNEGAPIRIPCEELLNLKQAFDAREMITDYLAQQKS
jgi:hypothetical protein